MHNLLETLAAAVVVVVVVVVASPATAEPRTYYGHGSDVRWPWLGSYRGPQGTPMQPDTVSRHLPLFSAPYHPSPLWPRPSMHHGPYDIFADYGDYSEPSYQASPVDELNRRILEAQRRCREDFLLLRRLLQEQHYLLKGTPLDIPQLPTTIFGPPLFPAHGPEEEEKEEEEEEHDVFDVDSEDDYDGSSDDDETNIFLDSPVPGLEWAIIPYLPAVPDADDLPDNYNNETHNIHVVNGTRVEVNTTTHKETGDSVTTFFHTEVFNVLPEEPEEAVTEEPVPTTTSTEEVPTTQVVILLPEEETKVEEPEEEEQAEEPPAEDETNNEVPPFVIPIPSAELVAHEEMRPQRDAPPRLSQETDQTGRPSTVTRHSAAYVKQPHGNPSKNKGKESKHVKPKDLSGDTLVNQLSRDSTDGKIEEPDAEVLL